MSDFVIRAVLITAGLACVGTEVFGTYEFLIEKHGRLNYLVVGGLIVTALAAVLPMAAEYARRNRMWALMVACWLAVPLTFAFVFTAAIQRTGTVMDTDEAGAGSSQSASPLPGRRSWRPMHSSWSTKPW